MKRRELIKLLSLGVIGHTLDIDKLLWVPGEKKIFFVSAPTKHVSLSEIVAIELERVIPQIQSIFESDSLFYRSLKR